MTAFSDTLIETDKTYLETIMSRRVAEYIVSEAERVGAAVTCSVECGWTEEGIPIPCFAVVRGGLTAAQRASADGLCVPAAGYRGGSDPI